LNERRRHYPPRSSFESRVEIERTGWDTLVSIETPDRPGLLHDLANAVSETGLDIRWARVQTLEDVARDNFHVVGEDGGPIDDPGVLGHLSMRIRELL
jgi:UTP:GlnB (protein PII) uridylyltransferase